MPIQHLDKLDELRDQVGDAGLSIQPMVALVADEAERGEVTALAERRFGGGAMGRNLVVGTTGELADHFAGLHAQGVERFYLWFADFAPPATLDRFAEVISTLDAAPGGFSEGPPPLTSG